MLSSGSRTGRLLFLKHGAVDVVVDDVEVVRISEPGAVFGDVALLLDQPHKADVRAVQPSSFHVVEDGEAFLDAEPGVLLYIAKVLARRLDAVNHLLIEGRSRSAEAELARVLRRDVRADQPRPADPGAPRALTGRRPLTATRPAAS